MTILRGLALWLLAMALIAFGCSRDASPIEPAAWEPADVAASDSHNLFGLYTFICDPDMVTVDVTLLRDAGMHLNALKFLEPPPLLYLTLESPPQFNGNILDVDIGLRNPYAGFVQFTGFDVCGIVFTHGSESGFADPEIVLAGESDTRLLNADSYTRWWNPAEFPHGDTIFNYTDGMLGTPADLTDFNCTINGYKYFADGLNKDDPLTELDISNRGMFSGGKKNIRHYKIDMSGGLIFNYAVDACWKKPSIIPPQNIPDDFPPGANRPEAYHVSVTELENNLYHVGGTYLSGGHMHIYVDVWDHYDAGLNKVYAESLAGLPLAAALTPVGGGEGYSTYELDFDGENLTKNGGAELFIAVQSEASGYGGILPGKYACAYFKHTFHISPDSPLGWALTWGGEAFDYTIGVAVDDSNNVYVTGFFFGTVDFDPGPGIEEHTSNGQIDAYLSKFDSNGIFQGTKTWGGLKGDSGYKVAVDGSGNVYVTGHFEDIVDFDPGPGTQEYTSNGHEDVFLIKFDSNGEIHWARTWGGAYGDIGYSLAIDPSDNIYIIGLFLGNVDFDPGPETDNHSAGALGGIFISKFNQNGDYQWARTWRKTAYCWCFDISADDFGNIYATAHFGGTVDFDPGPGVEIRVSVSKKDIFLSKFDSDGNFHWVRTWPSDVDHLLLNDNGHGVDVDESGDIFVTSWFTGTVDFDPGTGTANRTSAGETDIFLSKFNPDGDFIWVCTRGGPNDDRSYDVALDNSGSIYMTGYFGGTVDPGSDSGIDLAKFDPSGDLQWARTWGGGPWYNSGQDIIIDGLGRIYITGRFGGTVDFDPGPGVDNHTANDWQDAFLCRFPPDGNW